MRKVHWLKAVQRVWNKKKEARNGERATLQNLVDSSFVPLKHTIWAYRIFRSLLISLIIGKKTGVLEFAILHAKVQQGQATV